MIRLKNTILVLSALGLAACGNSTAPETPQVVTVTASESQQSAPSSSAAADPGQRAEGDFRNPALNMYAISSPDGKVSCFLPTSQPESIHCGVKFVDPPVDTRGRVNWESNAVQWHSGTGFTVLNSEEDPGQGATPAVLNPEEKVQIEGYTFETDKLGAFKASRDDHYFQTFAGDYFSDTFPPKPGSINSVCGVQQTYVGEQYIYVRKEGTDCNEAKRIVQKYFSGEVKPQGSRGMADFDGWHCGSGAPQNWPDVPGNRLVGCSKADDSQSVVLYKSGSKVAR
ncbi:hypothetical protein [Corynebacterium sp. H130]|uniref:hypothetical protein n=1 Tax=Corynebacterium sp. H130 TaxID=3133444 RepID=UPI0030B74569